MRTIDLKELFVLQKELDTSIATKHDITYKTTRTRRILALLVEISELANATRCFKYWSTKKGEEKERVLDEYADGLHFFLSLGIDISTQKTCYEIQENSLDINELFLLIYNKINIFINDLSDERFVDAFQEFLNLSLKLGFDVSDIIKGYKQKVEINHVRQDNSY